jgi:hypothetical protein
MNIMTRNRFLTLDDLRDAHKNGEVALSDELTVNDVLFHYRKSSVHPFSEMLTQNKYGVIVYSASAHKEEAKKADLNEWIILLWKSFQNRIIPIGVTTTSKQRGFMYEQQDQNIIGDTVEVKFTNLPSTATLKARVDTGAEISSLHADSVQVQNGKVRFISKVLSPNVLTMDMTDKQLVKSAGNNEYRPVISLNVIVNGKLMQGMMFNLNDRSQMEYPVLIGQNILDKAGFLINPTMEDVEWDIFIESLKFDAFEETPEDKTEQITELLTLLSTSDITFEELMCHMKTDAMETIEKIEY